MNEKQRLIKPLTFLFHPSEFDIRLAAIVAVSRNQENPSRRNTTSINQQLSRYEINIRVIRLVARTGKRNPKKSMQSVQYELEKTKYHQVLVPTRSLEVLRVTNSRFVDESR